MTNWEWPQYLLAGYWSLVFVIGVFAMLLPSWGMNYQKFAQRIIDIVLLSFILYMGGFWT